MKVFLCIWKQNSQNKQKLVKLNKLIIKLDQHEK